MTGAALALFLLTKFVSPLLGHWVVEFFTKAPKRRNKDSDFNRIVEQKKSMLRRGENAPQGVSTTPEKKNEHQAVVRYKKKFHEISSIKEKTDFHKDQLNEIKKVMPLFDSLQWGADKAFVQIGQQISKRIGVRVESKELFKMFLLILKRDWLLLRKKNQLPSYQEITSLFECLHFWNFLITELSQEKKPLMSMMAKKARVEVSDIEKSVLSLWVQSVKPNEKRPLSDIINGKVSLPKSSDFEINGKKLFLSADQKFFKKRSEWLDLLSQEIELFSSLSPLPQMKNDKDINGAFLVLGVEKGSSLNEVKKRYKKLAILKHPDKLSARGIPKEYEPVATENFALIQRAYDIVKKNS